uniref:ABC transporter permease n=1 Tax=Schistosoma curassoni TaxID=6186 RepID=A0A183KCB9_9TREM
MISTVGMWLRLLLLVFPVLLQLAAQSTIFQLFDY